MNKHRIMADFHNADEQRRHVDCQYAFISRGNAKNRALSIGKTEDSGFGKVG